MSAENTDRTSVAEPEPEKQGIKFEVICEAQY